MYSLNEPFDSNPQIEYELNQLLLQQPVDLIQLRSYSRKPGGYQTNQLRNRIWPKLLGINRFLLTDYRHLITTPHKDENQIHADVERSLWNYEPMKFWKETYRERRRQVLAEILMAILSKNNHLHYYQGLHDLVATVMLVIEDDLLSFSIAEYISVHFVSDYMKENFEIASKFMQILFIIIKSQDLELFNHLDKAKMEPFFAISWLITWFAHDIKQLDLIARIYDVLLCSPPIFCFYLCALYVVHLRDFILKAEPDFATIHDVLIKAPHKYGFPLEILLKKADDLYLKLPFSSILPLCDRNLFKIITCNSIVLFEKPTFQLNSVDSDWKLLEKLKMKKWDNLQYWKYYVQSTWGWTLSFLPPNSQDLELTESASPKIRRRRSASNKKIKTADEGASLNKKHRRRSTKRAPWSVFNLFNHFNDGDGDDDNFLDNEKGNSSFLSSQKVFLYITILIGGVLGYYIVVYRDDFLTILIQK